MAITFRPSHAKMRLIGLLVLLELVSPPQRVPHTAMFFAIPYSFFGCNDLMQIRVSVQYHLLVEFTQPFTLHSQDVPRRSA